MKSIGFGFHALVLVSLAGPLATQSHTVLLREGMALPGGEQVTAITLTAIDEAGSWISLVDTNGADLSSDAVVLRDGVELLREGALVPGSPPVEIDEFDSLHWESDKLSAVLRVRVFGVLAEDALYRDGSLLALGGDLVGAPEVSPDAVWDRFHAIRPVPGGPLFALSSIMDPDIPGLREFALARFTLDASGEVVAKNVLLVEGQFIPALGEAVTLLPSTNTGLAANARSDFMTTVMTPSGGSVLINTDTVIARDGDASPIPGRNYRALFALNRVTLNDLGEHAFSSFLDGDEASDSCIIVNGRKFVQEGDVVPSFSLDPLVSLIGAAPIHLANSGDVFWVARSANSADDAHLRNQEVIVQQNKSTVDRRLVTRVALDGEAFRVSAGGRFYVGRVDLEGVGDALVLADFGLVVPLPGCHGNPGTLRKAGGDARVGETLTLELDRGQALGAQPIVVVANRPSILGSECGILVGAGELFYAPGSVIKTLVGKPWDGTPTTVEVDIPLILSLVDRQFFLQGSFLNTGTPSVRRVLLTNGLRLEIGAP